MSDTNQRIADIVGANDVVLFMKGTPLFPQCGFSSNAIGNLVTEEDEKLKLRLVIETAEEVWGS